MLVLFLSKGVDVNAEHERFSGTALHSMASSGDLTRIAMLLKHGARAGVRDRNGHTALTLAKLEQSKHPDDLKWLQVIKMLEAAQKP